MPRVVLHAEVLLYHLGDPRQRPEVRGVSVVTGSLQQQLGQPPKVLPRQLGLAARMGLANQGGVPALVISLLPPGHRPIVGPNHPSDLGWPVPLLQQLHGPPPSPLQLDRCSWGSHVPHIGKHHPIALALRRPIKPHRMRLDDASKAMEDAFFIAANQARRMEVMQGRSSEVVGRFFGREQERLKERTFATTEMRVRDEAMISNLESFLRSNDKHVVALVVGYAHLDSIVAEFNHRDMTFIAAKMKASLGEQEPWELLSWERNKAGVKTVFTSREDMKEESRLQNWFWKQETLGMFRFLQEIASPNPVRKPSVEGLYGGSVIYENFNGPNLAARVGKFPFDSNAEFGDHVVMRGSVVGKAGEYIEVTDRDAATKLVKEVSDAMAQFVFAYRTVMGDKPVYRVVTPAGEVDAETFFSRSPLGPSGEIPRYVVAFSEGDEIEEGGMAVSPIRLRMCTAQIRGLLHTINPTRARGNIEAVEKQQPTLFGDLTFIEEKDIPRLSEILDYTPSRGDRAQLVVFLVRNQQQLLSAIKDAAVNKKLAGKQVALIMCGADLASTAEIRERLLHEGAVMVWTPTRLISPGAGERLLREIQNEIKSMPVDKRPSTIHGLIFDILQRWKEQDPADPALKQLETSESWVLAPRAGGDLKAA